MQSPSTTALFSVDVDHPALFYLVDCRRPFSALFITPFTFYKRNSLGVLLCVESKVGHHLKSKPNNVVAV